MVELVDYCTEGYSARRRKARDLAGTKMQTSAPFSADY